MCVQLLADVAVVLKPLAAATEILTTETSPAAGAVYYLLKELAEDLSVNEAPEEAAQDTSSAERDLDLGHDDSDDDHHMEEEDSQVNMVTEVVSSTQEGQALTTAAEDSDDSEDSYDSPVAASLKRTIWGRLVTRFSLEDDGEPEDSVCRSCPLLIAAFCDPRYLLFSIYYLLFSTVL